MDQNTEFAHLKTRSLKLRRGEGHLRWSRIFVSWILFSLFTRSRVASPALFFGSGCSSVYTRNKATRWVQVGRNLLSPVTAVILAVGGFSLLFFWTLVRRVAAQRFRGSGVLMVGWGTVTVAGVTDGAVLGLTGDPFVMLSLPGMSITSHNV